MLGGAGTWRQALLLALASVAHVALAPVAFALAVLAPTWFAVGGARLGWIMALLSYSFLVAVVAAPLVAWAGFSMRRLRVAWIAAAAPLAWIVAFGVVFVISAGL